MIELEGNFFTNEEALRSKVLENARHPNYELACYRARVMNTWFIAEDDDQNFVKSGLYQKKDNIIKRSPIESIEDYNYKLDRMKLFPLEKKFLSAQKRIYDENNINRVFGEGNEEFWEWKCKNFDDKGGTIDEFFRDKVLFIKETLGFGAVIVDVMSDDSGNPVYHNSKPVPYAYVVRPDEVIDFKVEQGMLRYLVIAQSKQDSMGEKYNRVCLFTPDYITVYHQNAPEGTPEEQFTVENSFGEVPAVLLKGDVDTQSGFDIGKPRRFDLKGLYLACAELFYDMMQGVLLFGHPVPVMSEGIVKSMAGVTEDNKFNPTKVKNKIGRVVVYPDNVPPPSQLYYQADMQGLQYLKEAIFSDLLGLIFQLAHVRDKTVVKSNVSADAKFLDNVEEQGLLSMTAQDMEDIENKVLRFMKMVRKDEGEFKATYNKHYDLSSADEIFKDITEGLQYKGMSLNLMKYLLKEYLRKRSAPESIIDEILDELDNIGLPVDAGDISSLKGIVSDDMLTKMATHGIEDTAPDEPIPAPNPLMGGLNGQDPEMGNGTEEQEEQEDNSEE